MKVNRRWAGLAMSLLLSSCGGGDGMGSNGAAGGPDAHADGFAGAGAATPGAGGDGVGGEGGSAEASDGGVNAVPPGSVVALIGPEGGSLSVADATVQIPAGALVEPTPVTFTARDPEVRVVNGTEVFGYVFDLHPPGVTFLVPVRIVLPLQGQVAIDRNIQFSRYDDVALAWTALPGELAVDRTIMSADVTTGGTFAILLGWQAGVDAGPQAPEDLRATNPAGVCLVVGYRREGHGAEPPRSSPMRASVTRTCLLALFSVLPLASACDAPMEDYEHTTQPLQEAAPTVDNMAGAVASDGASRLLYVWPLRGSDGTINLWGRIMGTGVPSTPAQLLVDTGKDLVQPEIVFANGKFWVFYNSQYSPSDHDIWYAVVDPLNGRAVGVGSLDGSATSHWEPKAAYDRVRNEILVTYNEGKSLQGTYVTPGPTGVAAARNFVLVPPRDNLNIQFAGHDVAFTNNRYGVVWNRMGSGEQVFYGSVAAGATTTIPAEAETQIAVGDHPTITAAGERFAMALSSESSGVSRLTVALVAASCATGNCVVTKQPNPILTVGTVNGAGPASHRIRYLGITAVGGRFFVPFIKHPEDFQDRPTALGFLLADAQGACVAPCERSLLTTDPGTTFKDVFITSSSVATLTVAGRQEAYLISRSNRVFSSGLTRLQTYHRGITVDGATVTQSDLQSL